MVPQEIQLLIATVMSITITVVVVIVLLLVKEEKENDKKKSMEEQYVEWAKSDDPLDTEEFRKAIMRI